MKAAAAVAAAAAARATRARSYDSQPDPYDGGFGQLADKVRQEMQELTRQEQPLPAAQTRKLARTIELVMEKLNPGKAKETGAAEAETHGGHRGLG